MIGAPAIPEWELYLSEMKRLEELRVALHQIRTLADTQLREIGQLLAAEIDPAPSNVRVPGKLDLTADAREWLRRRWRARMPAAEAARLLAIHPKSALKWYGRFAQEELQEELKPVRAAAQTPGARSG